MWVVGFLSRADVLKEKRLKNPISMASRKLTNLTLKQKIELIDETEKKVKKQKDAACDSGIPANTV